MNLGGRHAFSRPLLCYFKAMGATLRGLGTGLQGGQGTDGGGRGVGQRAAPATRPLASKTLRRLYASAAPRRGWRIWSIG